MGPRQQPMHGYVAQPCPLRVSVAEGQRVTHWMCVTTIMVTWQITVKICPANANPYTQATWSDTAAGQIGQGTCKTADGFQGRATRQCTSDGAWGAMIVLCTAIVPPCSQVVGYQGRTNWPATQAGAVAVGTCVVGFTFAGGNPPLRLCTPQSAWNNTVTNDCIVRTCH